MEPQTHLTFVAIDFETATHEKNSACSVAMVRVEGDRIVDRAYRLIRPPSSHFYFTYIHQITWKDVAEEPCFSAVWTDLRPMLDGVDFIAAHNASFDRSVLQACCAIDGLESTLPPFLCTVMLARKVWRLHPTKLPNVCHFLNLELNHHNAASDAEACAQIVIHALPKLEKKLRQGGEPTYLHVDGKPFLRL